MSTSPQVQVVSPLPHGHGSDDVASSLVPVERGPHRLAGGFVVRGDDVAWKPAIDVERVLLVGLGWGAAVAIVGLVARTRGGSSPVRTVTMGPGGWVSFRGADAPLVVGTRRRTRPSSRRRPWWAVLLRARPLT